jgi:hypothetical protein
VDTGVILAVVAINAVIGFIQEGKAEQAMNAVRKMLSLQATGLEVYMLSYRKASVKTEPPKTVAIKLPKYDQLRALEGSRARIEAWAARIGSMKRANRKSQ